MPDIHPLIDAEYAPYDIGVMGELDVRMLTQLFAGKAGARGPDAAVGWRHVLRGAEPRGEDAGGEGSTESVALLYLSQWKSEEAAADFAAVYADNLKRKYTDVHIQPTDESEGSSGESVFTTKRGRW